MNKLTSLIIFNLIAILIGFIPLYAQRMPALESPELMRGSNGEGRSWWDLRKYKLHLNPDISGKIISGTCEVYFNAITEGQIIQIDLQDPMKIINVRNLANGNILKFKRVSDNVYFIDLDEEVEPHENYSLAIDFTGKPQEALNPPWEGGVQWIADSLGRPLIAVSCQGKGASLWWPCKDIQSDEPDEGVDIFITIPQYLSAVSNGLLINKINVHPDQVEWHWQVKNPINNYSITMNIGYYVADTFNYNGINGNLKCSIYLLDYHSRHFSYMKSRVIQMLDCFESKIGSYPFYSDGYKITETPFLGMEHQSNIAYGNGFKEGYLGRDRSGTGLGLKWDFIIVHESGHEWFGNSITAADIADNWIHEGFTTYMETIFTECQTGSSERAMKYVIGQQRGIYNDFPLVAHHGINEDPPGDIYDKGANMINMIRLIINNDSIFYAMLQKMNTTYYHKVVTSVEIENFISTFSSINFQPFFNQYLYTREYPIIGYKQENEFLYFKLLKGASFPIAYIDLSGKRHFVTPEYDQVKIKLIDGFLKWDPAFLLDIRNF